MLLTRGRRCEECGGTGECPICFGSGTNVALNSEQETCPHCHGTGTCPTCSEAAGLTELRLSQ
jgi:DnaJ-class molecular chaperone